MSYLPHQQRVVDEKVELESKLAKIDAFEESEMYLKLNQEERYLLNEQALIMHEYVAVLQRRIELFGVTL